PLRIAELAAPARAAVAVHGVRGGRAVLVLDRRGGRRPVQRQVRIGGGVGLVRRRAGAAGVDRLDRIEVGRGRGHGGVAEAGLGEGRAVQRLRLRAGGGAAVDVITGHGAGRGGPGQIDFGVVVGGSGSQSGGGRQLDQHTDVGGGTEAAAGGGDHG